jgi:protein TonB
MTNTTIPGQAQGAASAAGSFYRWEAPGKPISVLMSLDLIDRLEREVLESFKAVTKRGSEIGGVLVGRVVPGAVTTVTVEQFEPVECSYSRGPLYLLTDEERAGLAATVARVKNSAAGLTVTGYFRSNTRRELVLDEEDLAIASESFSDPTNVLLLVRPFAMKPSAGGFFIWEDGRMEGESTSLQFAFKRGELVKNFAQYIVDGSTKAGEAPPSREPLVMPRREEPKPAPPPLRDSKPSFTLPAKRDEPPVPAPAALKREEPKPAATAPPKREEPSPLTFRREERPPIIPSVAKREERPAGPTLVSKRDEPVAPPPPAAKREEKPPVPPVTVRVQERSPITVKREEKTVAPPAVTKREEPASAKKEEKLAAAKPGEVSVRPAAVKEEAKPEPPAAPAAKAAAPVFAENAAEAGPGRSGALKWMIVALVVVGLAVGGYFMFLGSHGQDASKPADSGLGLTAQRSAGQLVVSWNRSAPAIASATRAILTIKDGDHNEDVELDLGTLRNGSVVYPPMTNDTGFRLEVTNLKDGRSVSESVRAIAGRPSPALGAAQPQLPAAKPVPGAPVQPAPATPAQAAATPVQAPSTAEPPKVTAGPAVTAAPPKPESLAARLRASAPQELPAPPQLEGSANALTGSAPVSSAPVAAAPIVAQAPAQQAAAPQAAAPVIGGRAREARLIKQATAVYPPMALQTRVMGTVRVRATVGKDGRVKQAAAVSGPTMLRQAAVDAVRKWIYSPALLNGELVESETQADVIFGQR